MKPNANDLKHFVFSHQHLLQQQKEKSRHSVSGHAYEGIEGISDMLRGKGGHIRKYVCGKRVNQTA